MINLEGIEHDCNPSVAALRLYSHRRNDHSHRAGIDHSHRRNTQFRAKASKIEPPADLWELEHYLTQSRKKIDRTFDYRYSVLIDVFGRLIRERRLSEKELQGLGQEKLKSIRSYAKFLAELDDMA